MNEKKLRDQKIKELTLFNAVFKKVIVKVKTLRRIIFQLTIITLKRIKQSDDKKDNCFYYY